MTTRTAAASAALGLAAGFFTPACSVSAQSPAAPSAGSPYAVTRIRFFPAPGTADRLKGGRFTGSLTGPTNDFRDLARIDADVKDGQWNEVTVKGTPEAYRYIKYEAAPNTAAAVGEIEFWAGDRKLTGTPFGTVPDKGVVAGAAFDGDPETIFRAAEVNFQYVGLDLGAGSQAAAPTVSAASGAYPGPVRVKLSSATPGATVRYTRDGSAPAPDRGEVAAPGTEIDIKESGVLVAAAFRSGLARSVDVVTAYRIGAAPAAAARPVTTFHIGNSLTDTVVPWMESLAAAGGKSLRFLRFTIPGAPTDWLWEHPGSGFGESRYQAAFLARAPIDHIFTQPFAGHGRDIANEAEYSRRFYEACRGHSPDVQAWLYVQWPSKRLDDGWSKGDGAIKGLPGVKPAASFEEAIPNFLRYAEAVRAKINAEYKGRPVRIVPAGQALADAKRLIDANKVPGMTDFFADLFSDDLHLNAKGAYLVSLVHYACVFGESPEGKFGPLTSGLTDAQARVFQRIAWDAAKGYPYSGVGTAKR